MPETKMVPSFITEAVVCPMCGGAGQEYSASQAKLVDCTLCMGRRWVPEVACRGCGRPAYKFWPPKQIPIIRYCGLEDCLKHLVNMHLPKKPALVRAFDAMDAMRIGPKQRA